MTTEEFLALPDDGAERWLIRGAVREFGGSTLRPRDHARVTARLAQLFGNWLDAQPPPRGELHGGATCRLRRDPDVIVPADVAFVSAPVACNQPEDLRLIDGVPLLVAEVLSPYDEDADVHDKIEVYLEAGVPLVWVVSPRDRTVRVCRQGAEMESFNVSQELSGESHLPGFRVRVASIFSR
jgi:Uma2 family endonuclease